MKLSDKRKSRTSNLLLAPDEYVPYAPKVIGEQIHTHHCRNETGKDKLYIRREKHGILAFCFHCNKHGFYSNHNATKYQAKTQDEFLKGQAHRVSRVKRRNGEKGKSRTLSPEKRESLERHTYEKLSAEGSQVPRPEYPFAAELQLKKHLTSVEMATDCFWSESTQRIAFPLWSGGQRIGFSLREVPSITKDGLPKWFPVYNRKADAPRIASYLNPYTGMPTRLVLVEDVLSAIAIARCEDTDGFALLGVNAPKELWTVISIYDTIYIWLDMDNHSVRKSAFRLKKQLEGYAKRVVLIKTTKDPKEYTTIQIERLLS